VGERETRAPWLLPLALLWRERVRVRVGA